MRYAKLDALRGVAVMGILLMNIIAFSMPSRAYINPLAWGGMGALDQGLWVINFILVDAKIRSLFSMLFGASMLLFIDRAEQQGLNSWALHLRRMIWLLLFGFVHLILIWNGDILALYAMAGLIAWRWRGHDARALIRRAAMLIGANFLLWAMIMGGVSFQIAQSEKPGASAETVREAQATLGEFGAPNRAVAEKELAIYRSGYQTIIADRIRNDAANPILEFVTFGFETLGLMALGMALLRNGFFTGGWDRRSYWRALGIGYGIGASAMAPLAFWVVRSGYDVAITASAVFFWSAPFRVPIALGHAAMVMLLLRGGWLSARLSAAGQCAFSNYIGTSILMTLIFYGYGFGLFGTLPRAQTYLLVIPAWALMLIWSKPWMDRFRHGPLEWLWRSLTRGALVTLRVFPG